MPSQTPPFLAFKRPRPTGNVLVMFRDENQDDQLRLLERGASGGAPGGSIAARVMSADDVARCDTAHLEEPILLRGLGIGLLRPPAGSGTTMTAQTMAADAGVVEARPEFYMYALGPSFVDSAARTWGVATVGADTSPRTGKGIRVAVLDTGFDLSHPDFAGRVVVSKSFVLGETVDDLQGHGTHCIGTAAGPDANGNRPRYGVATEAEIYVGKVLNNRGSGMEMDILAGMAWAIESGCHVISMSLGRPTQVGEQPSMVYERLGKRALEAGSLIVAAAGNESSREFGFIAPVGAPANSPSILAVAAIDPDRAVASFSCGGINPNGGEVDIAAPGVDVFSSVPQPELYKSLRGTSMACPHVAGVAALWAESDETLRGEKLWKALIDNALPLGLDASDVGAGLVQSPKAAEVAPKPYADASAIA